MLQFEKRSRTYRLSPLCERLPGADLPSYNLKRTYRRQMTARFSSLSPPTPPVLLVVLVFLTRSLQPRLLFNSLPACSTHTAAYRDGCFPYCLLHFDVGQPYEAAGALKFFVVQKPLWRNCLSTLPLGANSQSSSCLQFLWCQVARPTKLSLTGCVSLQAGAKPSFANLSACLCLVLLSSVDPLPWGQSGGQEQAGDLALLVSCRFLQRRL